TALSEREGINYGGGHVIEELIEGRWIKLRSTALPTDCYPRAEIETWINKDTVNQALMFNPRNAYQNYAAATNGSDRTIYTYMGILTPNFSNLTYSGAGELSPLLNDPWYRTIGTGTRIFLGGARGYVASQGTQHNPSVERTAGGIPKHPAGTLALMGNAKMMDSRYIRGARFHRYGVSLYVGIGIPIPILDEEMAAFTGVSAEQIETPVLDYSQPVRDRKPLRMVNFKDLRSGAVELNGKRVRTAPISSYKMAREIAGKLKEWIRNGDFYLSEPLEPLPGEGTLNTLEEREVEGKNPRSESFPEGDAEGSSD
ncbi:MAG: homocysteine biosynthesis protein, partial [Actinomycetota bacterium]|nr:homocysteine biosynthesis protein [Actinomycetota bacterium]